MPIYSYLEIKKIKNKNGEITEKEIKKYKVIYRVATDKGIKQTTKRGFLSMKEAKLFESKNLISNEIKSEKTLKELIENYKKFNKNKMAENSLKTYYSQFNKILEIFGDVPIKKITLEYVSDKLKDLEDLEINLRLKCLKLLFEFNKQIFNVNYDNKIILLNKKKARRIDTRKILSLEEYLKFREWVILQKKINVSIFDLQFYGGLRVGEVLNLKVKNVGEDGVQIEKGKTINSIRFVTLPLKIIEDLKKHIKELSLEKKDILFPTYNVAIFSLIKEYCKIENINFSPHYLRHSHASLLLSKNMPITAISKRLGHSNTNVTLSTYIHLTNKDKKTLDDFIKEM